jgi:hypothetical protein
MAVEFVGVDISANMRALAERYVASDRFIVCAPEALGLLKGTLADAALAVWVLQHCPLVLEELARIKQMLKGNGCLFVVNEIGRFIPTAAGWTSDGLDLRRLLGSEFSVTAYGHMNPEVVTAAVSERTFWGLYTAGKGR